MTATVPPKAVELVGRVAERDRLEGVLGGVAGGAGAVVLIAGTAGVGKTRLAREVLAGAARRGFTVLEGRSSPLNRALPYGPLVEALGRAVRATGAGSGRELVRGLPALGRLLPGLDLPEPEAVGDPALEKTRLFESAVRLLDRLSRHSPVALLLDDLHWFDAASRELVAYLARDLPALPLLVLATYRDGDLDADEAGLRPLVQSLRRAVGTTEIALAPLTPAEGVELARRLLGGDLDPELAERLARRTGGVPLFVEALVAAWRDQGLLTQAAGGWRAGAGADLPLPPLVRDAVLDRVTVLSPSERAIVELIAVAGGEVGRRLLEAAAEPADLGPGLARLLAQGLVVEAGGVADVHYGLAHPLLVEVAYEAVPGPRRRALHGRLAQAWPRVDAGDLDQVAVHLQRALPDADAGRALEVSQAAAAAALARFANQTAARHLDAALAVAREIRPAAVPRVLAMQGEARLRLGDRAAALQAWEEARTAFAAAGATTEVAELHRLAAEVCVEWGDGPAAAAHVQAGMEALAGEPDEAAQRRRLDLLRVSFYVACEDADQEGAARAAQRLDEAARRVAGGRAEAVTAEARGALALMRGDYAEAESLVAGAHRRLVAHEPRVAVREHTLPALLAAARGDVPALRRHNRELLASARRIGMPMSAYRSYLFVFLEALYAGDWARAEETVAEAGRLAETVPHPRIAVVAPTVGAVLYALRGDDPAARQRLDGLARAVARGTVPARQGSTVLAVLTSLVAIERDDVATALAQASRPGVDRLAWLLPPWALAVRAEAQAKAGQPAAALATAATLARLGPPGSHPSAVATRVEGLVAAANGEPTLAVERLLSARELFAGLGMPFEEGRAGIEAAEVARSVGGAGSRVAGEVAGWHATMQRLGASRYAARAAALLGAAGPAPQAAPGPGDLTPRQHEVARLVAEGLANAEIAERLYVSVRTVESHLDHIYTRLGIGSRVALATWVVGRPPPAQRGGSP